MVTHGYVVFKYERIYYIYYNHSDSYCSCLGVEVFNNINNMIKTNYINHYKKQLLRIPLRKETSEGTQHFYSIYDSLYGYEGVTYYTSTRQPSNEYVYIIDFDQEEYTITKYGNSYTFDLFDIPDDWMDIVETNEGYFYSNKKEHDNEKINKRIKELECEINELKLKIIN
jgi:hypothetical protein